MAARLTGLLQPWAPNLTGFAPGSDIGQSPDSSAQPPGAVFHGRLIPDRTRTHFPPAPPFGKKGPPFLSPPPSQDYVKTARAQGLAPGVIQRRHNFAQCPAFAQLHQPWQACQAGQIGRGAILTGTVFRLAGMALMSKRDATCLQPAGSNLFLLCGTRIAFNINYDLVLWPG